MKDELTTFETTFLEKTYFISAFHNGCDVLRRLIICEYDYNWTGVY